MQYLQDQHVQQHQHEQRTGGRRFKSCPRYQPRGPGLNRDRALPRARHIRRRHPAPRPVRARHQSVNGDAELSGGEGEVFSGPLDLASQTI